MKHIICIILLILAVRQSDILELNKDLGTKPEYAHVDPYLKSYECDSAFTLKLNSTVSICTDPIIDSKIINQPELALSEGSAPEKTLIATKANTITRSKHTRNNIKVQPEPVELIRSSTIKKREDVLEIVDYIRQHEGLRLRPYQCVGSKSKSKKFYTIGYGHVIKPSRGKYERGLLSRNISKQEAENILYNDFTEAYSLVINDSKLPIEQMTESQKLSLAHFVFALGIGTFRNSSLYRQLKKYKTRDVEDLSLDVSLFTRYSYVITRENGKTEKKFYQNLYDMRIYEHSLYTK